MKKLILILFCGIILGQTSELEKKFFEGNPDQEQFKRVVPNSQVVEVLKQLEAKVAFLESQLGQSYVAPVVSEAVLVDIQYEIDNAADWFYKSPRVQCVAFVESIKAHVEADKLPQAIEVIDFLVLNQAKYFYKSYGRRPVTVARFEAIKAQLE